MYAKLIFLRENTKKLWLSFNNRAELDLRSTNYIFKYNKRKNWKTLFSDISSEKMDGLKATVSGTKASLVLHRHRDFNNEGRRKPIVYDISYVTDQALDKVYEKFLEYNKINPSGTFKLRKTQGQFSKYFTQMYILICKKDELLKNTTFYTFTQSPNFEPCSWL